MQVLEHLKLVNFTTLDGNNVYFDENGDTVAQYDLLNWQYQEDGSVKVINIGHYDGSSPEGQRFRFTPNARIVWALNSTEVKYNKTILLTSFLRMFTGGSNVTVVFTNVILMSLLASKICLPGSMPCRKSQGH